MTLRELVEQHPDWMDHEMVVFDSGEEHYVGQSGMVYLGKDDRDKEVVVFSGD